MISYRVTDAKIVVDSATRVFSDGAVVAFEGLNLAVRSNEIVCIVGPSGCGKTTLLRCINGLIRLTEGRISIDGQEVLSPPPRVAMVFQHFGLFPWKRVQDNVAYGLLLQRAPREHIQEQVARTISLVGLDGFERAYPYQLSGGMQQRAGLARALATDPDVLLMDEPFGSLDAQTREILQEELLRILDQERKTMVFVTHSIDEAILLGDRIVMLTARPGRVMEVINVDLPRPRDLDAARGTSYYQDLRQRIWQDLRQEAA